MRGHAFNDKGSFALGAQHDCERPTLMTKDSDRPACWRLEE